MNKFTKINIFLFVIVTIISAGFYFKSYYSQHILEQFKYENENYIDISQFKYLDYDVQDSLGYGLLHYAVIHSNIKQVYYLLSSGINPNLQTNGGLTALHLASLYGMTVITKLLIQFHADLDVKDLYGNTALIYASRRGAFNTIKLLIQNHANCSIVNQDGETPLSIVNNREYYNITTYFIKNTGFLSHCYNPSNLFTIRLYNRDRPKTYLNQFLNPFLEKYILQMNLFFLGQPYQFSKKFHLFQKRKNPYQGFRWLIRD